MARPTGRREEGSLVVEPGEDHTFVESSDDYLVFVVQAPFVKGDKVELEPVMDPKP